MNANLLFLKGSSYLSKNIYNYTEWKVGLFQSDFFPPMSLMYLLSFLKKELPNLRYEVIDSVVKYSRYDDIKTITGRYDLSEEGLKTNIGPVLEDLSQYVLSQRSRVLDELISDLIKINPAIVAIPFHYAYEYEESIFLLRIIRKILPQSLVVVGGNTATSFGEKILKKHPEIDILVSGEGEFTIAEILKAHSSGTLSEKIKDIKGISYREDGIVKTNPRRELLSDLDVFPNPFLVHEEFDLTKRRDLVSLMPWLGGKQQNIITTQNYDPLGQILTSRGCPFHCNFCTNKIMSGQKMRFHSARYVEDVIRYCIDKFNIRSFYLSDAIFSVNRKRLKELAAALSPYKLELYCQTRADCIDEEILEDMKTMGMYSIALGLETLNPKIMPIAKKEFTVEKISQVIGMIRKSGIKTVGTFIIGLPGDNTASILKTARDAKKCDLDRAFFFPLIAVPGTEVYDDLVRNISIHRRSYTSFAKYESIEYVYNKKYSAIYMYLLKHICENLYVGKKPKLLEIIRVLYYLYRDWFLKLLRSLRSEKNNDFLVD